MSSLVSTSLSEAFRWIDENKNHQIELLRQAVAIPSVSGWPLTHRNHSLKCAEYFRNRLQELGFSTELRQLSTKQNIDGEIIDLPPLVLAQSKDEDPNKKILLVYAHIDVQPAEKSDGWDTEPFELTERNGKLFGRGATDDKGPAIAWTNAIEAFQKTGSKIPINIRFILEGMEESGSEGLEDELRSMKEKNDPFLQGIDFCVISDSYWLGQVKPCLAYGLRGIICCVMVIECANQDLHSGCCGGLVYEAMPDLIWLLDRLVDKEGNILIPGIMDQVRPMTQEEEDTYKTIDFDLDGKRNEIGAAKFINGNDPIKTLEHLWRFPCLSIHGIEGAFHEKGFKTVSDSNLFFHIFFQLMINTGNSTQSHWKILHSYCS